jgi:thioredoxin 1
MAQERAPTDNGVAPRWVFGLCAQWCGVCREWRTAFDAVGARRPQERFVWIDIEDEEGAPGDLEIETFPTLLVGAADQVLFFGTVLPSPQLLERLLASLDDAPIVRPAAEATALLQRLISRHM